MSDVKEKILDALDDVRASLARLFKDFREQSVYFKSKAAVVVGYVGVVVVSILVVPPAGEKNPLDARVKVGFIDFASKEKTYVMVHNDSSKNWDSATITAVGVMVPSQGRNAGQPVAGTWTIKDRWRRGEKKELFLEKFKDSNGVPPEADAKVEQVTVDVDGVQYIKSLVKKPGS